MHFKKLLALPLLLVALLAFSAFTFPRAASAHQAGQATSSGRFSLSYHMQNAQPLCSGWILLREDFESAYTLKLWASCDDGSAHAQLIANRAGFFTVYLYGCYDAHCDTERFLESVSAPLISGEYINTNSYPGYDNYDANASVS